MLEITNRAVGYKLLVVVVLLVEVVGSLGLVRPRLQHQGGPHHPLPDQTLCRVAGFRAYTIVVVYCVTLVENVHR